VQPAEQPPVQPTGRAAVQRAALQADVQPEGRLTVRYAQALASRLQELLGGDLLGVYVIGSLAWLDYHPTHSDVDILGVAQPLPVQLKRAVVEALTHERPPARGLEFVLYGPRTGEPAEQATAFQLNLNTNPPHVALEPRDEPAHWFIVDVAMARVRSIPLIGPPAVEVLDPIPRGAILRALEASLDWHAEHEPGSPNAVLNACRAWRYAREGRWSSKTEAGRWARTRVEDPSRIDAALAARTSG
jgi:hypothetical protein